MSNDCNGISGKNRRVRRVYFKTLRKARGFYTITLLLITQP